MYCHVQDRRQINFDAVLQRIFSSRNGHPVAARIDPPGGCSIIIPVFHKALYQGIHAYKAGIAALISELDLHAPAQQIPVNSFSDCQSDIGRNLQPVGSLQNQVGQPVCIVFSIRAVTPDLNISRIPHQHRRQIVYRFFVIQTACRPVFLIVRLQIYIQPAKGAEIGRAHV